MLLSAFYSDKYGDPCGWMALLFALEMTSANRFHRVRIGGYARHIVHLLFNRGFCYDVVWRSPRYRVAVATLSYGGRHVIVWRSPQHRMAVATFVCHPSWAIRNGLSLSVKDSWCIALKTNFKNVDFCCALGLKESKVFPFVEKMLCWYIFIFLIFNIQFFYVTFAPINLVEGCGNHKIQWLTMLIPPLIDCPARRAVEACSSC